MKAVFDGVKMDHRMEKDGNVTIAVAVHKLKEVLARHVVYIMGD